MIAQLPQKVSINDKEYEIRTDYRNILLIFEVMNDDYLDEGEKVVTIFSIFYKNTIAAEDAAEAFSKVIWFINCGVPEPENKIKKHTTFDWVKDEQMIFSAINKVAGKEVRAIPYIHWWTFYGMFNEIGEGMFSTVVNIRIKKSRGKKLEKWELEFYRENKDMIDLPRKYTEKQKEQIYALKELLGDTDKGQTER